MDRLDALKELLAKVEAGEKSLPTIPHWPKQNMFDVLRAANGSLDAAKALHEAVLEVLDPQYGYLVGPQYARIVHPSCGTVCDATSINPARAWLIAIIKALITQELAK